MRNPIEIHFTSGWGVSGTRGFDHDGQVGVILGGGRYYANAGSATGSAQTPGRAGNDRVGT